MSSHFGSRMLRRAEIRYNSLGARLRNMLVVHDEVVEDTHHRLQCRARVDSARIDMLAGLSKFDSLRTPPAFCAEAGALADIAVINALPAAGATQRLNPMDWLCPICRARCFHGERPSRCCDHQGQPSDIVLQRGQGQRMRSLRGLRIRQPVRSRTLLLPGLALVAPGSHVSGIDPVFRRSSPRATTAQPAARCRSNVVGLTPRISAISVRFAIAFTPASPPWSLPVRARAPRMTVGSVPGQSLKVGFA
jgi:hypothetical protein